MPRSSRWNKEQRAQILKDVQAGLSEQEVRQKFSTKDKKSGARPMTSPEFAQQLKQAMVEAGLIKQARGRAAQKKTAYQVTSNGRLTITNFAELTGVKPGQGFVLARPRGRSQAWRLVPVK